MEEVSLLIIILTTLFILNIYIKQKIINKYKIFSTDEFTHLSIIDEIKANKHHAPKIFKRFLIDKKHNLPFAYPSLFHKLCSYLKLSWLTKKRKEVNLIIDSLNILLLGITSFIILNNIIITLIVLLIYFSISFHLFESFSFTPRPLGFFIINLIMVLFLLSFFINSPYNLIAIISIVILSSSLFFIHKFTSQAMLICLLIFLIFNKFNHTTAIILIGIIITLIITKKYSKKIIKEHIGCIKKSYTFCKKWPLKSKAKKELIMSLHFIIIIFFFVKSPSFFLDNKINLFFLIWCVSLYIFAYLSTFIVYLRSVGQGERYIPHAIFPLSILIGSYLFYHLSILNITLIAIACIITILYIIKLFKIKIIYNRSKINKTTIKLVKKIQELPKKNVWVWVMRPSLSCLVMHLSKKNIINCLNISYFHKHPKIFQELESNPPKTIKEYNIDYILLNEIKFHQLKNKSKKYKILSKIKEYYLLQPKKG